MLCEEFVKLLMHRKLITHESAIKAISEDADDAKKTKNIEKRLYDIANVLSCFKLIKKIRIDKKLAYIWKGTDKMEKKYRETNNDIIIWAPFTTKPQSDAIIRGIINSK